MFLGKMTQSMRLTLVFLVNTLVVQGQVQSDCGGSVCDPATAICDTNDQGVRQCVDHVDLCSGSVCLNGGDCQAGTCVCTAEFTGTRCDIDKCADVCLNGASCSAASGTPVCTCEDGFSGELCGTDECAGRCVNGGTCVPTPGSATCDCPAGFEGDNCQTVQTNPCSPNPCQQGAVCNDVQGDFSCACPVEFGGDTCQIDKCADVCLNGASCSAASGAAVCTCLDGYSGELCETDECAGLCVNGGTCVPTPGPATCDCPAGFEGDNCQTDKCLNFCKNSGTCDASSGSPSCTCANGFTGDTCETDECAEKGCANGAMCDTSSTPIECICPLEYMGDTCETSKCDVKECLNQAACDASTGTAVCTCTLEYEGDTCENRVCDVQQVTCLNGGTCVVDSTKTANCQCLSAFTGDSCEIDVCAACLNGADCDDSGTCQCTLEYTGTTCESLICTAGTCQNSGTCSPSNGQPQCACKARYSGDRCQTDNCPCLNSGTCIADTVECNCPPRYTGNNCEIDSCASCENGATCNVDGQGVASCVCPAGYTGANCETDQCAGTCENGGSCTVNAQGVVSCVCGVRYEGDMCQTDKCDALTCANGAECAETSTGVGCACPDGYSGPTCSTDLCAGKCESGSCERGPGIATCSCPAGFTGQACETDLCDGKCQSGSCERGTGSATCSCPAGFTGASCETDLCSGKCQHGGTCAPSAGAASCNCLPTHTGPLCQTEIVQPCDSNPCLNSGQCVNRASATNGYICVCPLSYKGPRCQYGACRNVICQNGGTCNPQTGGLCACPNGFDGQYCQGETDSCEEIAPSERVDCGYEGITESQCQIVNHVQNCCWEVRGGAPWCYLSRVITVQPPAVQCQQAVSARRDCAPNKPGITIDLCTNRGCCWSTTGSGPKCFKPYTEANKCVSSPCINGGSCATVGQGFICTCTSEFYGDQCEFEYSNGCTATSCINGGTCTPVFTSGDLDGISETACTCRPGYTGPNCESDVNECPSSLCDSIATCVNTIGSYRCQCPDGFVGSGLPGNCLDACISMEAQDRKNCGFGGIQQDSCEALECCWDSSINDVPWCFLRVVATAPPPSEACVEATNNGRENCAPGISGIDRLLCNQRGCCFDDTPGSSDHRCFYVTSPYTTTTTTTTTQTTTTVDPCSTQSCGPNQECVKDGELAICVCEQGYQEDSVDGICKVLCGTNNNVLCDPYADCVQNQCLCRTQDGFQADPDDVTTCISRCADGDYWRTVTQDCEFCPLGTYWLEELGPVCTSCPNGQTTAQVGSVGVNSCVPACPLGQYRDDNTCITCPIGTYKDTIDLEGCTSCPAGQTTSVRGATTSNSCRGPCTAGHKTVGNDCVDCELGTYSTVGTVTTCTSCPTGRTTLNLGSTSVTDCITVGCNTTQTVCQNGGYCIMSDNTVVCVCLTGFTGPFCTATQTVVQTIIPRMGPVAGGTSVTITGVNFRQANLPAVQFGTFPCAITARESDKIVCTTSAVSESLINIAYELRITWNDEVTQTFQKSFIYKPNPSVTLIKPLETLLRGGTIATITGFNLANAGRSTLEVKLLFGPDYPEYKAEEACRNVTADQMICPYPHIALTDTQKIQLGIPLGDSTQTRRRRSATAEDNKLRVPEVDAVRNPYRKSRMRRDDGEPEPINDQNLNVDFTIVVVMDGVRVNYTEQTGSYVDVYVDPTIEKFDELTYFRPFWPFNYESFTIKAKDIPTNLQENVVVKVGDGACEKKDVYVNEIVCYAPKRRPAGGVDSIGRSTIVVEIGYLDNSVGLMKYQHNLWEYPPGRAGILGGSGGLLFIIIVIIICCVCRPKRRRKSKPPPYSSIDQHQQRPPRSSHGSYASYHSAFDGQSMHSIKFDTARRFDSARGSIAAGRVNGSMSSKFSHRSDRRSISGIGENDMV